MMDDDHTIFTNLFLKEINIDDLQQPIYKHYYLIEMALFFNKFDIIKKILKLNVKSYTNVGQNTLMSLVDVFRHNTILEFLSLLDISGQQNILSPMNSSWFLPLFFNSGTLKQIKQIMKYDINYNTLMSHNHFILLSYLDNVKYDITNDMSILKQILISSKQLIKEHCEYIDIIIKNIFPFNSKIMDTILEIYPNALTFSKFFFEFSPLTYSINTNNFTAFNYIINYAKNNHPEILNFYNVTYPIVEAIRMKNVCMINELLKCPDINLNVVDEYRRLPAHNLLLELNLESYPISVIECLIRKTDNINLQDITGTSVLFLLCRHNLLLPLRDILEKKICYVFIKNKEGLMPINVCKDISLLANITTYGFINNSHKMQINSTCLPKLKNIIKSSPTVNANKTDIEFRDIYECIYTQIKEVLQHKKKIHDETATINFIKSPYAYNNLFQARISDTLCYCVYFKKKYDLKFFNNNEVEHYGNTIISGPEYKLYINCNNIITCWTNETNYIFIKNFDKVIKKLINGIYYIDLTISPITKEYLHANTLIIDANKRIVIRFEPYGTSPFDVTTLDVFLDKLCKKANYSYVKPSDYMDYITLQIYDSNYAPDKQKIGDPGGFCLAWAFWFLEYYLLNPDMELKELLISSINQIINSSCTFREYIRSYANKLANWQLKFLKKEKYSVVKFFNYYQTVTDQEQIIKIVQKYLD